MAALIRPATADKKDKAATEAIAEETHTDVGVVQEIYQEELSALASDARITQFLGVLTSRRVKLRLKRH